MVSFGFYINCEENVSTRRGTAGAYSVGEIRAKTDLDARTGETGGGGR